MKKLLALLCAFAMIVSLCACTPTPSYEGTAEELEGIVEMIAEIPVATMGVSMTITSRAVDLLDWCAATSMSGEEIAAQAKQAYDALDPAMQEMFLEQVALTVNAAANLSKEALRDAMLESAGFDTSLTWSDDVHSLAACLDDQL